ncbi:hypothetical protein [Azotobacter beijerinckii]|nr:hypothetical protein [Azotobacter beijerinckii]
MKRMNQGAKMQSIKLKIKKMLKEQQANTMYFAIAALGLMSLAAAFMLELGEALVRITMIIVFLTGIVIWVVFEKSLPFFVCMVGSVLLYALNA